MTSSPTTLAKTRIVDAANTYNPALLLLVAGGYTIDVVPTDESEFPKHHWQATKEGCRLLADTPLALLGLVRLHEVHGDGVIDSLSREAYDRVLARDGADGPVVDFVISVGDAVVDAGSAPEILRGIQNAALEYLEGRGYALGAYRDDGEGEESHYIGGWVARHKGVEVEANAIALVGLADIADERGADWGQKETERDIWDEAFERAYPDDED